MAKLQLWVWPWDWLRVWGSDWFLFGGNTFQGCQWAAGEMTREEITQMTSKQLIILKFRKMIKVKSEVLTGSNSKVCKAPEFNVMVSLSEAPLAPSEDAVERENGALNLHWHWSVLTTTFTETRLLDSQTCVICTGICSAVTGLGESLADREPTTTTLFIADGGASTTSCSPFNKTTPRRTHCFSVWTHIISDTLNYKECVSPGKGSSLWLVTCLLMVHHLLRSHWGERTLLHPPARMSQLISFSSSTSSSAILLMHNYD